MIVNEQTSKRKKKENNKKRKKERKKINDNLFNVHYTFCDTISRNLIKLKHV